MTLVIFIAAIIFVVWFALMVTIGNTPPYRIVQDEDTLFSVEKRSYFFIWKTVEKRVLKGGGCSVKTKFTMYDDAKDFAEHIMNDDLKEKKTVVAVAKTRPDPDHDEAYKMEKIDD